MSFILLGVLNSQVEAAGGGSFDLLETTLISTNTASVTFSSLGSYSAYKHLQIRYTVRASADTWVELWLRMNNSSSGEYARHQLRGTGSQVNSEASSASDTKIMIGQAAQTATTQAYYAGVIDILDFGSSNKNTTTRGLTGYTANGYDDVRLNSGLWNNTAAVTSLTILPASANLASGSRFSLYGIK